ncbi:MAG TPA: phosphoribosylamine--glycine ligase [Pyrinomonadaceae bacterium]|jgi:phosphoribosylamine--glycine ligase
MKVLIIGTGGREHALCWKFNQNKQITKIFCASGNAGIGEIAECVDIKPDEIERLAGFAEARQIDLTFVGGETSLALGVVDEFEKRNLKIVGVSQKAARLEASKSFAKDFMRRNSIPTAKYKTAHSAREAKEILQSDFFGDARAPIVVKADGLAAGKGVVVAANRAEAVRAIDELENLAGREAARQIVLEECLTGRELSLLAFADGENFALMPPVRDHKRIYDDDRGANTGGMGTISDKSLLSAEQIETIIEEIIKPTLKGCRDEGFPFQGILFLGLMLTPDGIKVLEYNVRFGDPETQSILVLLETDLTEICEAMLSQTLDKLEIRWRRESAACVVLASKGYPAKPQTGDVIDNLEKASRLKDVVVFHAGTAKNEAGEFITAGGRVLGVTARAENLDEALNLAYRAVGEISFEGMQYRLDIGK